MTIRELINRGRAKLEAAGVSSPEFDSKVLCSFVTGVPLSELPLRYADPAGNIEEAFYELIRRRASGEPLQYITGEQEFMGLSFRTDPRCLIPRLDTEILAEEALKELAERVKQEGLGAGDGDPRPIRVLDLCCGTGAIGLSVLKLAEPGAAIELTLSDISEDALSLAKENAVVLGFAESNVEPANTINMNAESPVRAESYGESAHGEHQVNFVKSDLFEELGGEKYDIILSNPPYIPADVIETLDREVRDHEPLMALDGGSDGLDFYRRISHEAADHLMPGGALLLEIGCEQAADVTGLLSSCGGEDSEKDVIEGGRKDFSRIRVIKDLAGKDRVVTGKLRCGLHDQESSDSNCRS